METRKVFSALILIGLISVFLFSCSEDDDEFIPPPLPLNVSIRVAKTNTAINHYLWAYLYAKDEKDIANPEKVLAVMYKQITSDTTEFILQQNDGNGMPNGEEWLRTKGVNYDIYVYTDSDNDGDPETGPTVGRIVRPYPNDFPTVYLTQGGTANFRMQLDVYDSFYSRAIPVTLYTDTVDILGHYLWATIYNENETDVNNPDKVVATMFTQIGDAFPKITLQESNGNWEPNGTEWLGEIGKTYDIYVYTDSDDDNNPATGPTVGKIINPAPQTIFVIGKQSFEIDYNDMVDYE